MTKKVLNEVAPFHTLEDVMRWAFARKPPAEVAAIADPYARQRTHSRTCRLSLRAKIIQEYR
jgi:hypothetical protein